MKLFLDTANLEEITTASSLGVLDGVTTNPSLMAKEGITAVDSHYSRICELVDGDVSAEVIATGYAGILQEGRHYARLHPNIVVKVPMIPAGIQAIKTFSEEGIKTNCTLVFSPQQALMAAKAGATYVSPFLGRLEDEYGAKAAETVIQDICSIFKRYSFKTQVLAASIRNIDHVRMCAIAGADVATIPYKVFQALMLHPLTDRGLDIFLRDYAKLNDQTTS
ncbi:MAG: fructose-6-phosphate aldolase [Bacteroidia bacterium]|nr:fructose-6-phosphate aldolase [Bacteroidia bacterium]